MINEKVDVILRKHNAEAKHQQDLIQWYGGVSRCLCVGCHGSMPHLTKTLVVVDKSGRMVRNVEEDQNSM